MKTEMPEDESPELIMDLVRSSTYEVFLATNYWRNLRERAFEELGRSCRRCGQTEFLHVHHKTYERLGRERISDLEVLCRRCHQTKHPDRRLGYEVSRIQADEYEADERAESLDPLEWWTSQVGEWEDNIYEAAEPGEKLINADPAELVDEGNTPGSDE
jgi:5-methylcytosine-specific restriction endonuclease McrA